MSKEEVQEIINDVQDGDVEMSEVDSMEEGTPEPEAVSRKERVIPDLEEEEEEVKSTAPAPVPAVTMAKKPVNIFSTPRKAVKTPEKEMSLTDRILKYRATRDAYRSRMMALMDVDPATSIIENEINEYQRKLDLMIKRIASLETSMSPKGEDKLDYRNDLVKAPPVIDLSKVPKLHLASFENSHATSKVLFESIEHFVHEFEMTIHASRNQIEDVWRLCIPVAIPFKFTAWSNEYVVSCSNWEKPKEVLMKKFGNLRSKEANCIKLFDLRMKNNQTVVEYTNEFINLVDAAELNKDDKILVLLYRARLLEPCRQHISAAVEARKQVDPQYQFSINELCDMGREIFGDELVSEKVYGPGNQATSMSKRRPEGASVEWQNFTTGNTATSNMGCPKHGGERSSHTAAECTTEDNVFKKGKFLGNANYPYKATRNPMKGKPCKFCNKVWKYGHECQEYWDAKGIKGKTVLAVHAEQEQTTPSKIKEAMEVDPYECKYKSKEERNPLKLTLTPIIIRNTKVIARIDTGSDISFINKYILEKQFDNKVKISKVNGNLNFLSLDNKNKPSKTKRIGKTEPLKVRYTNDISFDFAFEVVEFNSIMESQFDVLLGLDILTKLRISLSGVAYCYPDEETTLAQFQNVNFDTENKYDPENADYGTEMEREHFLSKIRNAVNDNKNIIKGSFCTMPEAIVSIPLKEKTDNMYIKQYPLVYHQLPEIERQIKEWVDEGIVYESVPNPKFNTPLLTVGKKDDQTGQMTKVRVCMDLRRVNANIDDSKTDKLVIPDMEHVFAEVSSPGRVYTKIDLKNAYFSFPVDKTSQEILSFTFKNKTYRWKGCCFGLSFISQQYSRVISHLFKGMDGVRNYIDYLCIYSAPEDHAELVNEVIEKLTCDS
ncbi:hypothetical protein INT47_007470 [Mucor saturninus]|uniref:Reverse transcriptase domain-containing protein n=1 Tax=Mucor saturninus TaxID=64648 RepID=A0A8H7QIK7_9FUNG|nr:hypothetical protein INT47_007470 [Mucor saturninus]